MSTITIPDSTYSNNRSYVHTDHHTPQTPIEPIEPIELQNEVHHSEHRTNRRLREAREHSVWWWGHQSTFIFGIVSWGVGILEINYNFGFGMFLLLLGGFICLFEILFSFGVVNNLI